MSQKSLLSAIAKRQADRVEKMLKSQPHLRETSSAFGLVPKLSALFGYFVCLSFDISVVVTVVTHATLQATSSYYFTPLQYASKMDTTGTMVELLITLGCNVRFLGSLEARHLPRD